MKKVLTAIAASAALMGAVVVGAAPASSADSGPVGYTTVFGGNGCELVALDLTSGELTDLPAAPSSEACVTDLAATADGAVWGISAASLRPGSSAPQAQIGATLVRFSADGTATLVPISVAAASFGTTAIGGIAVSPGGTVYVHLVTDDPACDTGTPPGTVPGTSVPASLEPLYAGDSVCLYTVDPSTGAATIVGTTGLFETVFSGLSWCGALTTFAVQGEVTTSWATESTGDGSVTLGAQVAYQPAGYDCDSATGSPLYALTSPQAPLLLDGVSSPTAYEATLVTVDPATGATTTVAQVSGPQTAVMALAVVGAAAGPAVAADVVPAFTG